MAKIIDTHFADEAKQFAVGPGKTVEEIVRACDIPEGIWSNVVIVLNGTEVARSEWGNVFPNEADVLSVHVVPLGSDSKQILRLVAVVAIAIAAPGLGTKLAATTFGKTLGLSAGVAQAGITIIGTLAVNALIPPPTIRPNVPGGSATSNAYFLSGQSNRARPYEIVPVTYGTHKLFANVASAPHIFSAGTSSIFQGLYDFGVGGYDVSNIVAGTTPLYLFKNQSSKLHTFKPDPYTDSPTSAFRPVELDIYNFPFKATDLSIGLNDVGDQGVATTHPEAHTAVLEISFPAGLTYFDDTGNNQGTYVKFYVSYRQSGTETFLPIPRETKGFAGDDHLSFTGIDSVGGNPSGPTDPEGEPIYAPQIGAGPLSLGEGEKTWVRVGFVNGNPAYYGDGIGTDGDNPDRPKESFWWENIDTGEVYQTKSTYNGLSESEYDPSQWSYNQEPDALSGYTDVGQSPAMGTMVMDDPGTNKEQYAFQFVAPNVAGRWCLKMDLYEWWRLPYGTIGNTRIAESQGTFQYAGDLQGNPHTFVTTAPVVAPPGQIFNDQTESEYSHIYTAVEGPGPDGPWTVTPPTSARIFWFKGGYYQYDFEAQGDLVWRQCFGAVMKVIDPRIGFNGYVANGYCAVKEAETQQLIDEGVLVRVAGYSRVSEIEPAIININSDWGDNWPGVDNIEEDENGTYFKVYGNEATPGIVSLVVPLPSAGSYDFRVSRYMDAKAASADAGNEVNESRYVDSAVWSRLGSRGLPSDKAVLDLQHRHTLLELEFEANESIAGNVQEISATIRPYLRSLRSNNTFFGPSLNDSNGDTAYDNPAWVVLDILTGWTIQNKRAPRFTNDHCGWLTPDQLDLGSFYDFAQYCNQRVSYTSYAGTAQRKRYATNLVMASDAPVIETVQNILGQCRAQLIINQAGKISIMRDEARTTPRQLFTPSNSWDFSGERSFTEIPHCFNVQFISPELGWQQATVKVYRPGYDATGSGSNEVASVFEDLDTIGITNAHQAQLYGSYMLAQATIRSERFTLSTDVENLVCQRGDLVEVAHDAPLMGGRSAVITGEVGGWLHISESFDRLTDDTDTYTLRTNDGDIRYGSVTAISGNEIQIENQSEAGVGDLIVIGPSNRVTEKYLIQGIRPKPDLTAEITLVKYDTRVYEVDSGQFPVWNPNFNENISTGGRYTAYSVTGASTLIYQVRQPYTEAVISWDVYPDNDSVAGFFIEYQTAGGPRRKLDYVSGGTRTYKHIYSSRDTAWGSQTVYFIIPYSSLGYRGSEGRITLSKRVDSTPPTVSGFTVTFTDNSNTRFTWDDAVDPDIEAFSIYYKPDPINPGYGGEKIAQPSYGKTEWLLEGAREGLFWIIATDTSGNNSDSRGSFDTTTYPTPGLVQPFWIDVFDDRVGGMLHWGLLNDPTVASYSLYQSEDVDELDIENATLLSNVGPNVDQLAVEWPFGAFWIVAQNIYGVVGPANRIESSFADYPAPGLVDPFWIDVFNDRVGGMLYWESLEEPGIVSYSLYHSYDADENDMGVATKLATVGPTFERLAVEWPFGAFWIFAQNVYGVVGPANRIESTPKNVLGISPFTVTVFEDRVGGQLDWGLLNDPSIKHYIIYQSWEPAELDIERATLLGTVGANVDFLKVERPFGAFWILAENIYGAQGPATRTVEYYRVPEEVDNFRLYVEQSVGVLRWDLLSDVYLSEYQIRYTEDADSTDAESAAPFGSASPNTDNMPSEKLEGAWFIRGVNIYGIAGPWSDTNSVIEGLAAVNGKVTQTLTFIGRFPFSDATVRWQLQGSESVLENYRVFFYPTNPDEGQTYQEPDELVVDRPPVLVYEGPEKQFTTTVSTTQDTGRQHGYFAILPISIYGTAGVAEYVDFDVIKDVTPPLPPERFFVNMVSNTNADLSWLASQSVDVDTYDLRYTPNNSSPRWEAAEHIATVGYNVTGYQTNARTGTYLIRATDTSGNVSDVVTQRTTVVELPEMNIVERVEEAPDWEGKKVYFVKDGSRLLMQGAPYTGGDDFGAEPYREATYYYHERVDLGRVYETRLTAKLQAYGQLSGSIMADWDTLAEIDPISGVEETADWDCWVEYRTGTQEDVIADWVNMAAQDPISGVVASDWTDWRAFFAADVTARFIDFRIVARAYNPNAEVGVISGLIEVDMPDRYWTKSDIPVGVSGASVLIDPPFKHLEAVAVTVDGNDYNVRAIVEDKKPWGFTVKLINQTNGNAVPGQVDVFASGYGIERPEVI
jgi:hypothetical protein